MKTPARFKQQWVALLPVDADTKLGARALNKRGSTPILPERREVPCPWGCRCNRGRIADVWTLAPQQPSDPPTRGLRPRGKGHRDLRSNDSTPTTRGKSGARLRF